MIDYQIRYVVSAFLNAQDINAETTTIQRLLSLYTDKGFIPTIFQELNVLNGQGIGQGINRIRLQSTDGQWLILFASNRVEISKNAIQSMEELGSTSDFLKEAIQIIERFCKDFDKKSSRIGFVTSYILQEMSKEKLYSIHQKLFKSINLYLENPPFEWNWRNASHVNGDINGLSETFNVVTELNRLPLEMTDKNGIFIPMDRINLNFDINTVPQNENIRFGNEEIKAFGEFVLELNNKLLDEVINHIN